MNGLDTAKDARVLVLEDALNRINEIVANRKLKLHIEYGKLGDYLKTAGSLLYEVKYSYIEAAALADLESTTKILESMANFRELYTNALNSGYKPSTVKESLTLAEMDYAFRIIEGFPTTLRMKTDDPAYAVDILAVEISQAQPLKESDNLTECRCSDGSRIWNIITNITGLKSGTKLACAVLPPVEMMNNVSDAMFLGSEPLPDDTNLGPLDTPPDSALDQARAQVLQITKRMK